MKKRIISLLLCLSLVFGFAVPAMTPEADAFIGKLIMTGVKMSASIIKSCVNVCKNQHEYDNAGQAVGVLFKNAAKDFLGMGGSSGGSGGDSGGGTTTTIINQVDLSVVESSLADINKQLTDQTAAIYQLESTVNQGLNELSDQLSVISAKIDELKAQVSDSTQLLQYYTYLNTFFEFFNQYYEALSYYDREINLMLSSGGYTEEAQKNLFDRFYQLSDVEYTGTFHSAVDKLGRYLQGSYLTSSPGSVVDVLSQYYITYYTLLKEADPKVKAASDTEDMIGYLYYAYVMGVYYEQAIAMYQTAVITETGSSYKTDFGTVLTQTSVDNTVETLWTTAQSTVGCILRDLINNYRTSTPMPVVYQVNSGEILNRYVSSELFHTDGSSGNVFHVQLHDTLTFQDPVNALSNFGETGSGYFSKEFCEAFAGLSPYQSTENLQALDDCTFQVGDSFFTDVQIIEARMGSTTVLSIPVSLYEDITFFAGDGTEEFPFLIRDRLNGNSAETQIGYIFGLTSQTSTDEGANSIYADCHFVLGQDVDMQGKKYTGFTRFSGSFDGNGYTLKNFELYTRGSNQNVKVSGLFGNLTGTVRNLNVENGQFVNAERAASQLSSTGNRYGGMIAGLVEQGGRVEYCQVKNSTVSLTIDDRFGWGVSTSEDRNLIAGGAVGCVGNNGSLDTVVVIDTQVKAQTVALNHDNRVEKRPGLTYGTGQAFVGGVAGALAEGGSMTRCSYNQTEGFKSADGAVEEKLYAQSNNFAAAGGLIGWSEATEQKQVTYSWSLLSEVPSAYGPTSEKSTWHFIVGHHLTLDSQPCRAFKLRNGSAYNPTLSTITVETLTSFYNPDGKAADLDLTPFSTDDTDILELHFRTEVDGLVTPPTKLNYAPGEYLNLSGFMVYQSVGRCRLDTQYKYSAASVDVSSPLHGGAYIKFYYDNPAAGSAGSISTGTTLSVQERPHFFTTKTLKAATCTETGTTRNTCLICGKQEAEVTTPALGHHAAVTKHGRAATCTEDGLTDEETCVTCGEVITEQTVIPAAGHHTETRTILEPTCVSGGVKQETCTVCGEVIRLENLKPLGHDYKAVVTEPTCETPGYTTHTCTRCGDSYTDSYTAPTDHHYGDGVITREPTCTEPGEMTYTCSCGETHTEPIPTIDHDYAPTATDPTCTEMGYTTHTCIHCGASYRDSYTAPAGHDWDEGITVTPPTLIADGLLRRTCTVCGTQQDTAIPSLTSCDGGMDCPSRKFNDVADIHDWSHIGIDYALRCSLFYGTSSTTFSPNAPMTRAMLVTVLYRMEGRPSVEGQSHRFEDVPEQAWYEDALIWASSNGIVNGVSDTAFEPDSNVTRQQVAAILYRYAAKRGYDVSASTDLSIFPDSEAVADYARTAMSWANAAGLLQGSTDGEKTLLLPDDSATRAQLAAILMRFMKTIAK